MLRRATLGRALENGEINVARGGEIIAHHRVLRKRLIEVGARIPAESEKLLTNPEIAQQLIEQHLAHVKRELGEEQ
jgi:hypothetical protein